MIEVIYTPTGDRAEAETPEAAIVAARTLADDARSGIQGATKASDEILFLVDGVHVRTVRLAEIRT